MDAELLAAERALHGSDAKTEGRVRLTASDGVANYLLIPALGGLRLKYPGLTLELRSDARNLDLSRREADIALRLSRPKEPSLIARRMGTLTFSLFGGAGYLARKGTPRKIQDLRDHDFITFDADVDVPQSRWLKRHIPELRAAISVNTTSAQVSACNAGTGLALLPNFIATHYPELVQLLPQLDYPTREIWCVTHEDVRTNARVMCVIEWLRSVL
jgi:DNA-binding transcriptional LysR family regulator